MTKILFTALFTSALMFASDVDLYEDKYEANCIILENENSIICKYVFPRVFEDRSIKYEWINPIGKITREKEVVVPAGHGSSYDLRFLDGRKKGIWTFKVSDKDRIITTTFELK